VLGYIQSDAQIYSEKFLICHDVRYHIKSCPILGLPLTAAFDSSRIGRVSDKSVTGEQRTSNGIVTLTDWCLGAASK